MSDFYKDLIELTNAIATVEFNSNGHNYRYADLSAILKALKPLLLTNNFSLMQPLNETEKGLYLTTILRHITGKELTSCVKVEKVTGGRMSDVQALGAGITYMRRYAISSLLNISSEEDTDAAIPKKTMQKRTQNYSTPRPTQSYRKPLPKKATLDPKTDPKVITEKATKNQKDMMWALVKEAGVEATKFRAKIKEKTGDESTKDATKKQISDMIEMLQEQIRWNKKNNENNDHETVQEQLKTQEEFERQLNEGQKND